jgi:hypothetical protein
LLRLRAERERPAAGPVVPDPVAPTIFEQHPVLRQYGEPRPAAHPAQPAAHAAGGGDALGAGVSN